MYKYEKCVQQKFKQSSCQVLPLIVHMTFKAEDVCGTAGSSGTLRACRSHQLCKGTCWAKQEAATWACSASRDLWPPDCSWCMQSTLLLTPHGDAGCLSHYMLLTLKLVQYLNIQELMASGRSSRGWFSSIKLWSIRRWTFGFTDHHLPCLALRGSHLKLHPNLSLSQDWPFYFHQLHSLSFCSCPFLMISSRLCVIQSHKCPSPQKQAFLDCACSHPRVSQTAICCSSKLGRQR